MRSELNIAVVSTNKNKYSETFIHNHVGLLPGKIHFLFDGYLPKKYSTDKGLSEHVFCPAKSISDAETVKSLEEAIAAYLTAQKADVVLCEYGPSGVAMLNVIRKTGIPLVVHFFGYDAYRQDILSSYGQQYARVFEEARFVVVVSENMKAQLLSLGCPHNKLQILYCGVDTQLFKPSQALEKKFDFIACSRFVAKKSPLITIRAFAAVCKKNPAATLVMVGDGDLLETCKQRVKEMGLEEGIFFTGALTLKETAKMYACSGVFVQHSVTTPDNDKEGTPLAVLMAGAFAMPVVCTRHGGIPDVVEEGRDGYLVNEGDEEGMTEAMLRLLKEPDAGKIMGQHFRNKVERSFSLTDYTQKLAELLERVVHGTK